MTGMGTTETSLMQQKQAWLRAREELRQAQIVTVNQGLSLTPSLYFGTRRCTYSTVVTVVTTASLLPRPHQQQTLAKAQLQANDALRWAEKRPRAPSENNQTGEVELRSPYAVAQAVEMQQHQRLALLREHRAFMESLQSARRIRARREHEAALVIQRVRRGFVLRRQFRSLRQKLLVRKRIRGSLLQVTKGTAIVLGEKDRRSRLLVQQRVAALRIQGVFRIWAAQRLLAKLRSLARHERLHHCVAVLQGAWRACLTRWMVAKLRVQREQAQRQTLANLLVRLFTGFQARRRVRALRLRREAHAAFLLQSFVRRRLLAAKALRQARARRAFENGHDGAAHMQQLARGMLQRAHVMALRRAEQLAVHVACVLVVQRVVRGFLGRQRARRRGIQRAHERGWTCAMHVTRLARGFLARLETSLERDVQQIDLLVQARRGNVAAVVDLLDGFDPAALQLEEAQDDEVSGLEPADVTRTSAQGGNNVLHLAAKFGHLEVVTLVLPRLLATAPALVYARNRKGWTPLALAIVNSHERVALYLLAMTSSLFVDHVLPGRRRTLLHEAARRGLENVVAKLLQLFPHLFTGAERDGWTQRTVVHEALLVGVQVVQDRSVSPWTRHHSHKSQSDSEQQDQDAKLATAVLETVLAKAPLAPLDAQDFVGFTALHVAAARGNLQAVMQLLVIGVDVTVQDAQGRTAWRVALLGGHEGCFQEIRRKWLHDVVNNNSAGQRVGSAGGSNAAAGGGTSATSTASSNTSNRAAMSSRTLTLHPQLDRELMAACEIGDVTKMRFFIDECGGSPNTIEEEDEAEGQQQEHERKEHVGGRSLLMIACERRDVRAVAFLLGRDDLDATFTTPDGRSALSIARSLVPQEP
ncbi:hypothetical protein BBJ28_00002832 [Nothophytophthora sp. Chile5]|nr:hypothetical protein BBJ28_00002832 [Nothophytophthora sp. Chile5]